VGWSFVSLGLCRLLQFVALLCRSERSKELEILVLRHELAILCRQPRRAPVRPVDRAILAALAGALLLRHGLTPASQRDELSWRNFLRQQAATTLACDFFTVATAWLKRIYALFFLSLERRRIEFVACTANPTSAWTAQQARNLPMTIDDRGQPLRLLLHDRGSAACAASASTGCSSSAGASSSTCYASMPVICNRRRPHRSLAFRPPEQTDRSQTPLRAPPDPQLNRRDLLGGLIHEHQYAA
jgi:hypothetical protein